MDQSGQQWLVRDLGAVESAGPRGQDSGSGLSLIQNHPFVDGNKREATVDAHQR